MSGHSINQLFRAALARLSRARGMSVAEITANSYAQAIASALRESYGDRADSAKEIANEIGAGIGTVRKWLSGENGPSGEHLLKLMASRDAVWARVVAIAGREDNDAETRERMRKALAILEGRS